VGLIVLQDVMGQIKLLSNKIQAMQEQLAGLAKKEPID
jgi:hypothetical protein